MTDEISPNKSRVAVTYIFFALGMLSGNWISRISNLQAKFMLICGELDILPAGLPIGSVIVMGTYSCVSHTFEKEPNLAITNQQLLKR